MPDASRSELHIIALFRSSLSAVIFIAPDTDLFFGNLGRAGRASASPLEIVKGRKKKQNDEQGADT
jgi:hypothetical protein